MQWSFSHTWESGYESVEFIFPAWRAFAYSAKLPNLFFSPSAIQSWSSRLKFHLQNCAPNDRESNAQLNKICIMIITVDIFSRQVSSTKNAIIRLCNWAICEFYRPTKSISWPRQRVCSSPSNWNGRKSMGMNRVMSFQEVTVPGPRYAPMLIIWPWILPSSSNRWSTLMMLRADILMLICT